MNVKISKRMKWQLEYDWDVEEVKSALPKLFPKAKSIKVTDCKDDWLEVLVDETYYSVNAIGYIKEGKLCEVKM